MKRLTLTLLLSCLAVLNLSCGKQSPEPVPVSKANAEAESAPAPTGALTGEQLYMTVCVGCHNIEEGAPHKVGPNLYGLANRAAATAPGFTFSEALQNFAESGLTWQEGTLIGYVVDSEAMVPGTWMLFNDTLEGAEVQVLARYVLAQGAGPKD